MDKFSSRSLKKILDLFEDRNRRNSRFQKVGAKKKILHVCKLCKILSFKKLVPRKMFSFQIGPHLPPKKLVLRTDAANFAFSCKSRRGMNRDSGSAVKLIKIKLEECSSSF